MRFTRWSILGNTTSVVNLRYIPVRKKEGRKEDNVLFIDALNTLHFIYGYMVSDMVKDRSDS